MRLNKMTKKGDEGVSKTDRWISRWRSDSGKEKGKEIGIKQRSTWHGFTKTNANTQKRKHSRAIA